MFFLGKTINMFDFAKQKNPLRGNVTLRGMERYFADCADLETRELRPGGGPVRLHAVWLDGLTDADRLARVMMKHTTTLGIRRQDMSRYALNRSEETVSTPYGDVRIKRSSGMDTERIKPEYDDLAAIAREKDLSLNTIRQEIR